MSRLKLVGGLVALSTLLAPGIAHAQLFTDVRLAPPRAADDTPTTPDDDEPRFRRFHIGSYGTIWDFPSTSRMGPLGATGGARLQPDADLSALITADYFITRDLSIGMWWNPFSGDIAVNGIPGVRNGTNAATFNANYWDAHLTYYIPSRLLGGMGKLSEGWSIQGGFSGLHYDVHTNRGFVIRTPRGAVTNFGFSQYTPNVWLNKSTHLGSPRIAGKGRPITLLTSFGYQTSSDFNRALNVIVGGSIGITDRLSLSSSVWFNDLDDVNTRITFGIVSSY